MAHFSRHRDLTLDRTNPTHALKKSYNELMAIEDHGLLAARAISLFQPFVGKGISVTNWEKFKRTISDITSLTDLQFYLTNYLMAASGLATVK
jgi:hypothetical protein